MAFIPAKAAENSVTVNSLAELQDAIVSADDGDMVYIAEDIEIQDDVNIGVIDKTVFLAGVEGKTVSIFLSPGFPDGQAATFVNLVFCGNQSSGISFVQHGGASLFQMVRFQHPNESSGESACFIEDGDATFSNCNFEGGYTENGTHIYVGADATVRADTCTFMAGVASDCGGSIYSLGSVNITDCNFANSCSENEGGSVYAGGALRLMDCTFDGGASGNGGQILCADPAAEIVGCLFTRGYASVSGGGLSATGDIAVSDCTITDCSAGQYGGGIWSSGTVTVQRCRIFRNSADAGAADLYAATGLTVADSVEDYLSMYEDELSESGMDTAGWYLDGETQRYTDAVSAEVFSVPSESNGQPVSLAFALQRTAYSPAVETAGLPRIVR